MSHPSSRLKEAVPGATVSALRLAQPLPPVTQETGGRGAGGELQFCNQMFTYKFLLPFLLPCPVSFLFERNVFKHLLPPLGDGKCL